MPPRVCESVAFARGPAPSLTALPNRTHARCTRRPLPQPRLLHRTHAPRHTSTYLKSTPSAATENTATECAYCHNTKQVVCPVCNGEGILGRTIICRYCRGAKTLECPICAAQDDYSWSYVEAPDDTPPPPTQ